MNLENSGLYAIHFTAIDKAENNKTSRKLVLYDNKSHVSFLPTKVTRIGTASAATNYTWVNEDTTIILAIWTDRFQNIDHEFNRWLTVVSPYKNIEDIYDDHHGRRTIEEVPNVYGLLSVMKQLYFIQRLLYNKMFVVYCNQANVL